MFHVVVFFTYSKQTIFSHQKVLKRVFQLKDCIYIVTVECRVLVEILICKKIVSYKVCAIKLDLNKHVP